MRKAPIIPAVLLPKLLSGKLRVPAKAN